MSNEQKDLKEICDIIKADEEAREFILKLLNEEKNKDDKVEVKVYDFS